MIPKGTGGPFAPGKKPDGACQVKQALKASNRMRRCTMKSGFVEKDTALKKTCQIAVCYKKITIFPVPWQTINQIDCTHSIR